jgi:hypothetical protein
MATKKSAAKKAASKKKGAARKPAARRAKPAPRTVQNVRSMTGGVVANRITVGRDMINGDQINIIDKRIAHIGTPQDFVAELQKVQAQMAEMKKAPELQPAQARRLEVVEADVQDALVEAGKPAPVAERINATLTTAKETMDNLGGGLASAVALGATLAGLAQVALKVFGVG